MSTHAQILELRERLAAAIIGQKEVIDQLLIALLAPLWRYTPPLPPPRAVSPPERRLHLTLCVWRE